MKLFNSKHRRISAALWLTSLMVFLAGCTTTPTTDTSWQKVTTILDRIQPPTFIDKDYIITDYGAVGNGKEDCTEAFKQAIAACNTGGGGRVVVPAGTYLTGAVHFKNNVNLYLAKDALITFSTDPNHYLPTVLTRFEGTECINYSPLLYAFEQKNIAITGEGTLDGCGSDDNWWKWTKQQKPDVNALCQQAEDGVAVKKRIYGQDHFLRPNMVQFYRCKNILIEGVTFKNSPMWHLHPVLSSNITVRNVTVSGHGPNNDGCDPESCKDVLIENCFFDTGDDCIAIKSGRNADGRRVNVASENLIVRKCTMKEGHGGVVIGSEISGSVRNVFAEDCMMDSPNLDRGLRIKTNSKRGGIIENIYMRNVTIRQVAEAALKINYYYQEGDTGPFTPIVRNVFMTNVTCHKSKYPWHMRGYDRSPIKNVVLKDCVFENTEKEGVAEAVEGFVISSGDEKPKPQAIKWSQKMIESEMQRNPESWMLDFSEQPKWKYAIGVELKGIWQAGLQSQNEKYLKYVQDYYDKLITDDGQILTYQLDSYNIDNINPGKLVLDLYSRTPKEKYKTALFTLRNQMRTHPRVSDGGFWHKKIYPHQMWLDGIYMGTPFLAQYGVVFKESGLFDEAAKQIILMNQVARDPRTGLLYHGWDESHKQNWADPQTGCSPNFWGRSMGWYLMAIVDTLDFLPPQHPKRKEVLDILNQTVDAISHYQDSKTGLWYQVLDKPNGPGNYLESSCSSMFVYAILKATRLGYVPEKYRSVAEKGYKGILDVFIETTPDGQINLTKGCAVAGLGGNPYRDGSYDYYINEKIRSNDPKAVGPFILASLEYESIH